METLYVPFTVPDEPYRIEWTFDMDQGSFLAAMVVEINECARQDDAFLVFVMDEGFVEKYMSLDESSAEQVTNALQRAPISVLKLWDMAVPVNTNPSRPTRASSRRLTIWNQLCTTLASMESITKVYCFVEGYDYSGSLQSQVMPRLARVSSLIVCATQSEHFTHISEVAGLVAGLEASPELKQLYLSVPAQFYATVLPAFQCTPAMKMVSLSSPATDIEDSRPLTRDQALALADFLRRDLPVTVTFQGYDFSGDHCTSILCHGIAESRVHGLGLDYCFMDEDFLPLLARSMAQSRLRSLTLIGFTQDDLFALFQELGSGIANMSQLEEFVCERPFRGDLDSVELDDLDDHLVGLVQGLAQCSRLKTSSLPRTA